MSHSAISSNVVLVVVILLFSDERSLQLAEEDEQRNGEGTADREKKFEELLKFKEKSEITRKKRTKTL